jgi:hypothetical protein
MIPPLTAEHQKPAIQQWVIIHVLDALGQFNVLLDVVQHIAARSGKKGQKRDIASVDTSHKIRVAKPESSKTLLSYEGGLIPTKINNGGPIPTAFMRAVRPLKVDSGALF